MYYIGLDYFLFFCVMECCSLFGGFVSCCFVVLFVLVKDDFGFYFIGHLRNLASIRYNVPSRPLAVVNLDGEGYNVKSFASSADATKYEI